MRSLPRIVCGLIVVFCGCAGRASDIVLSREAAEIVVAADAAPVTRFAAKEAAKYLGLTLGGTVPVVTTPTPGKASVILGVNAWTKAAGLAPEKLPRDGFQIRTADNRVLIAGVDDPKADLETLMKGGLKSNVKVERATVFGVYEFLERFCGTRFYFVGELGTVVQPAERVVVPPTDFTSSPRFTVRHYYQRGDGPWHQQQGADLLECGEAAEQLNWVRLRMHTRRLSCCHGQNAFDITRRFCKTHPEYLQLRKDGMREDRIIGSERANHLCQSTVYDQFFEDIKAYCESGANPGRWEIASNGYVDVMPHDGFRRCHCPKCTAAYSDDPFQYATDLVWGETVRLANRLKAAKIPIVLTQMAYSPYARVPDFPIPDNVRVMVARTGPWSTARPADFDREVRDFRAWNDKMGAHRNVWAWTYPEKCGQMAVPLLPHVAPRAMAKYYMAIEPYVFGAYAESISDKAIYNYLNYYVFSRIAWYGAVDIEALLSEHHRLMFGPAAPEMAAFFDGLEECWVTRLCGRPGPVVMGPVGPELSPPSDVELYRDIYSLETIDRWESLFARAAAKVPVGSLAARRIRFFKEEFLDPLAQVVRAYNAAISVSGEMARRRADRTRPFFETDFAHLGGWTVAPAGTASIDTSTCVSRPGSLLLASDDTSLDGPLVRASVRFPLSAGVHRLKPSTRYRVSCFMRWENVKPLKRYSGVNLFFFDNTDRDVSRRHFTGSSNGWIHQSVEFVSKKNTNRFTEAYLMPRMVNCTGRVWFDDIRIDELKGGGE